MRFRSTRGSQQRLGFSEALWRGLAEDGGLYVPETWPLFSVSDFDGAESLAEVGERLLAPFVEGDPLATQIGAIVREAFNFSAPLRQVRGTADDEILTALELSNGPTAAFKDFGARFLAACFQRIRKPDAAPVNILVATSGDTGGAVAAAFHGRSGMAVTVLFPKGLVSPTQQHQLTCWGDNVRAFAVRGTFDECQRLVKEAFGDAALRQHQQLSSANSINLGRLLPQAVYYAATSLAWYRKRGRPLSFIIPSGNLGNAVACLWARQLGLPIVHVVLAHNANRTVPDFLSQGEWLPRASIATLASAMDVGNPSNMERMRDLFPDHVRLCDVVSAISVEDSAIRHRIREDRARFGEVWCPHTAVAAEVWATMSAERRRAEAWCLVSTASPAKFPEVVEPLIEGRVSVPETLARLFDRPSVFEEIDASLEMLKVGLKSR